jgi:hypothetical protein
MRIKRRVFFISLVGVALAVISQGSGIAAGQGKGSRLKPDDVYFPIITRS